jgi:DNA replication protein DnaC
MVNMRESDCWYKDTCDDVCYMCNTYLQLKWQMDNSGLPKTLQKPIEMAIINKEDEKSYRQLSKIRKNIVSFVSNGNNLYLCSNNTGNGKTSWAVRMLQTYLHYTAEGNYENLKGMFVSVPDLLLKLKDFNNPLPKEYKDNLENVDLVIWDDIAVMGLSDYDYTQLYTLINNRILAEKSNIFTSNITNVVDLIKSIGERITSRVFNTSEVIELKGKDIRDYGSITNIK